MLIWPPPPQNHYAIFGKIHSVLPESSLFQNPWPELMQISLTERRSKPFHRFVVHLLVKITHNSVVPRSERDDSDASQQQRKEQDHLVPIRMLTPDNAARGHISYLAGTKHHCLILSIKTLSTFFYKLLQRLFFPFCSQPLVYLDPISGLHIYFI